MKDQLPLTHQEIQSIKLDEYQRFFSRLSEYDIYMNHLGEIRWMTGEQAEVQHEFFIYDPPELEKLKKRWRNRKDIDLQKIPLAETELRLHIRVLLEKKYLGEVRPETSAMLPGSWEYEFTGKELENIPLILSANESRPWKRYILIATILIVLFVIFNPWFSFRQRHHTGQLLVQTNQPTARIYMDGDQFIGYANRPIWKVPVGTHRVTIQQEGFQSVPEFKDIRVVEDSLTTVTFDLKPMKSEVTGYLKVNSNLENGQIYINNRYYGTLRDNSLIDLKEGQYNVRIETEGYVTVPAEKDFNISAGDTARLTVQQIPLTRSQGFLSPGERAGIGSIDISSTEKNARIFMNGKDTGARTDHVFTQLDLGNYQVSVVKDGYSVSPEISDINLTQTHPSATINFRLTKEYEKVRISTEPADGSIFIDNKLKGKGSFEGELPLGNHKLSFGKVEGYNMPNDQEITVEAGHPLQLQLNYFPKMNILAAVGKDGELKTQNCTFQTGYVFPNRAFTASKDGAPRIVYVDEIKQFAWKFGYAFQYRNPKGSNAVKLSFKLPRNLKFEQKFTLQIVAGASQEKYPLTLSARSDVLIKFNNTILSYYYRPDIIEDSGKLESTTWDLTPYIKSGQNVLEINTTDKNNIYYLLQRIEISN